MSLDQNPSTRCVVPITTCYWDSGNIVIRTQQGANPMPNIVYKTFRFYSEFWRGYEWRLIISGRNRVRIVILLL